MVSLVKDIVSLEAEAESIIGHAHEAAKKLETDCEKQIASFRQKIIEETNQRISEFRIKLDEAHRTALVETEREQKIALDALESIPDDVLQKQVEQILTRLWNQ
jgi:vacuolar-type H+-ATPase subunit H